MIRASLRYSSVRCCSCCSGTRLPAQEAPRAQQPTDFKGVELKNRAPVSNEILRVKFPRPPRAG